MLVLLISSRFRQFDPSHPPPAARHPVFRGFLFDTDETQINLLCEQRWPACSIVSVFHPCRSVAGSLTRQHVTESTNTANCYAPSLGNLSKNSLPITVRRGTLPLMRWSIADRRLRRVSFTHVRLAAYFDLPNGGRHGNRRSASCGLSLCQRRGFPLLSVRGTWNVDSGGNPRLLLSIQSGGSHLLQRIKSAKVLLQRTSQAVTTVRTHTACRGPLYGFRVLRRCGKRVQTGHDDGCPRIHTGRFA